MIAPPSPSPRRVGVARWLDARLVAGLMIVLASTLLGAHVMSRAEARTQVLAFARDLAAGTTIQPTDLVAERVALPSGAAATYVDRLSGAAGMQVSRPVQRGELVTRASVRQALAATTVALPLAPGAAPALHRGDRIVVWASTKTCPPAELIPDASVQDVSRDDDGSFGAGTGQRVVLQLPDEQAAAVVAALAQDGVTLRVGTLAGPPRAATTSSAPRCRSDGG